MSTFSRLSTSGADSSSLSSPPPALAGPGLRHFAPGDRSRSLLSACSPARSHGDPRGPRRGRGIPRAEPHSQPPRHSQGSEAPVAAAPAPHPHPAALPLRPGQVCGPQGAGPEPAADAREVAARLALLLPQAVGGRGQPPPAEWGRGAQGLAGVGEGLCFSRGGGLCLLAEAGALQEGGAGGWQCHDCLRVCVTWCAQVPLHPNACESEQL